MCREFNCNLSYNSTCQINDVNECWFVPVAFVAIIAIMKTGGIIWWCLGGEPLPKLELHSVTFLIVTQKFSKHSAIIYFTFILKYIKIMSQRLNIDKTPLLILGTEILHCVTWAVKTWGCKKLIISICFTFAKITLYLGANSSVIWLYFAQWKYLIQDSFQQMLHHLSSQLSLNQPNILFIFLMPLVQRFSVPTQNVKNNLEV